MGEIVASLVPLILGIVMSPLAIMALVAVLVSKRSRINGAAYMLGWVVAVILSMAIAFYIFGILDVHERHGESIWVPLVRLVFSAGLVLGAIVVYRKGASRAKKMAAATTPQDVVEAAPQLPGWLKAVSTFTPVRSALLGFGIFILHPIDLSCMILAMVDIRISGLSVRDQYVVAFVFSVLAIAPIAIPVIFTLVKGKAAEPLLNRVRTWIAGHTNVLNAALLLLIGAMQLQKAISELLS